MPLHVSGVSKYAPLTTIIQLLNLGLKAVMQLQPLHYEYKPDNAMGIK